MIDKVLERSYVLSRMETLGKAKDALKGRLPEDLTPNDPDLPEALREPLTEAERDAAREALLAAAERGWQAPVGPAPELERGTLGKPVEERAFFPRDPAISLAQSVLEAYLYENRGDLLRKAPGAADGRRAGEGADPVATDILDIELLEPGSRRLAGPFEVTDIGWAVDGFAMGWRLLHRRRPFEDRPADSVELADDGRVLVVGDWASGHHRAREVSRYMREWIEDGERKPKPPQQHVIHLGDTYYGGWKREYRKRFLPHWPVQQGEAHTSWSLNGNHDMDSGGHGYFDYLLKDARFAAQQRSSWFSLEGKHWQLLGLDTAWDDHGLKGGQAEWIAKKRRDNPSRKTMLLSHHQLFSAYGGQGPDIEKALKGAGELKKPFDAWLWGHEHRCVVYKEDPRVRHARLVGHGGVPVYADSSPNPDTVTWRETGFFQGGFLGREKWTLFGFAVLDFRGADVDISYVDEWGRTRHKETIS